MVLELCEMQNSLVQYLSLGRRVHYTTNASTKLLKKELTQAKFVLYAIFIELTGVYLKKKVVNDN